MPGTPAELIAHESEALDEIELYGELIIAAAADPADRLSLARIDEVLRVCPRSPGAAS